MLPATDGATPSADRFAALDALRRRVAIQSCADAGEGVKARRVLFSLDLPAIDLRTALDALDNFERAIVEHGQGGSETTAQRFSGIREERYSRAELRRRPIGHCVGEVWDCFPG
ncbi:MAG: hypothetical protein E5X92_23365 [Mesorhizobium sp.]|nr:MAG: hypothetical protein E5X92_23365 [Mesorhizobium sp.]